jgi:hypothetical protein
VFTFQEQLNRVLAEPPALATLATPSPLFPLPVEAQGLALSVPSAPASDPQPVPAAQEATPAASSDGAAPATLAATVELAGLSPDVLSSPLGGALVAFLPGPFPGVVLRYPKRPLPTVRAISAPTPFRGPFSREAEQASPGTQELKLGPGY